MTSLRFAKKFCFSFRIKHFYAYVWKLTARGLHRSRIFGCGLGPRSISDPRHYVNSLGYSYAILLRIPEKKKRIFCECGTNFHVGPACPMHDQVVFVIMAANKGIPKLGRKWTRTTRTTKKNADQALYSSAVIRVFSVVRVLQ